MAEIQDASAAVQEAKANPQPDQSQNQDGEYQSLQAEKPMLARQWQAIQDNKAAIEHQVATGQLGMGDALAYKQRLEQYETEVKQAFAGHSEREKAYMERMRKADEVDLINAIPRWADSKVRAAEARQLNDYLAGKGMSQEQISKLTAQQEIAEYRNMQKTIKANQSRQERMLSELDEKLAVKQQKDAKAGTPPPGNRFSPPVDNTNREFHEKNIADRLAEKQWEELHGRKLTARETAMHRMLGTGTLPRS